MLAAEARVALAALAVLAEIHTLLLVRVLAAAAVRVDRRLLLVRQEHLPLAALAAQGELQAPGVPEPRCLYAPLRVQTAAAAVADLVVNTVL
jgi:hypothetical protein